MITLIFLFVSYILGVFTGALISVLAILHREKKENEEFAEEDLKIKQWLKSNLE